MGSKSIPRQLTICQVLLRSATFGYGCFKVTARFVPICHDFSRFPHSKLCIWWPFRHVSLRTSRCVTVYLQFCNGRTRRMRWQKKYETSTPVEKLHLSPCVRACLCVISCTIITLYELMYFYLLAWSDNHLGLFHCVYMYIKRSQVIISRYFNWHLIRVFTVYQTLLIQYVQESLVYKRLMLIRWLVLLFQESYRRALEAVSDSS